MADRSLSRRRALNFAGIAALQGILGGCTGKQVPSQKDARGPMSGHSISLDDLRAIDAEARKRFQLPYRWDPGVGSLGLILNKKLDDYRYELCTPTNCKTFAATGGDGVHYSLLVADGRINEQSPVVITNPGGGDSRSWIVGENLFDFLCLGYYRGYFALEQLAYYPDLTLEVYTNPNWKPSESWHDSVGYVVAEEKQPVLDLLISRFSLRPWTSVEHFHDLQKEYGALLKLPR